MPFTLLPVNLFRTNNYFNTDMKYVYALVGNNKTLYFEQTCVSAYSLKLHNPEANICLVVDSTTHDYIKNKSTKLLSYFDDIIVGDVPADLNNKRKSRVLKTKLRKLINGDYLFIDSDTIICDSLCDIISFEGDFFAVPDKHLSLDVHPRRERIIRKLRDIKYDIKEEDKEFFNSGVTFVRDTPCAHKLYSVWYEEWEKGCKYGVDSDQPSLLVANHICGYPIKELDGVWNCQIIENGLKYLVDAKILHYFSSDGKDSCFEFKNDAIFEEIKSLGYIPDATKVLVKNAKRAFTNKMQIVSGKEADFLETSVHKVYVYHKSLFNFIEKILCILYGK